MLLQLLLLLLFSFFDSFVIVVFLLRQCCCCCCCCCQLPPLGVTGAALEEAAHPRPHYAGWASTSTLFPLYHPTSIPLYHYTHYTTVPLYTLYHYTGRDINTPLYHNTTIPTKPDGPQIQHWSLLAVPESRANVGAASCHRASEFVLSNYYHPIYASTNFVLFIIILFPHQPHPNLDQFTMFC